jgi:hypothetical protein
MPVAGVPNARIADSRRGGACESPGDLGPSPGPLSGPANRPSPRDPDDPRGRLERAASPRRRDAFDGDPARTYATTDAGPKPRSSRPRAPISSPAPMLPSCPRRVAARIHGIHEKHGRLMGPVPSLVGRACQHRCLHETAGEWPEPPGRGAGARAWHLPLARWTCQTCQTCQAWEVNGRAPTVGRASGTGPVRWPSGPRSPGGADSPEGRRAGPPSHGGRGSRPPTVGDPSVRRSRVRGLGAVVRRVPGEPFLPPPSSEAAPGSLSST